MKKEKLIKFIESWSEETAKRVEENIKNRRKRDLKN